MPLGNGDVTANVFINESIGAVSLLLSKQDAMASTTDLFKLGLVNVMVDPNPFVSMTRFRQSLHLNNASISIIIETDLTTITANVWIDANSNTIVVSLSSSARVTLTVTQSTLRPTQPFVFTPPRGGCRTYGMLPDVMVNPAPAGFPSPSLVMYHRTNYSIVNETLHQQGLDSVINVTKDWWLNNQFGFALYPLTSSSAGWERKDSSTITSAPITEADLALSFFTRQTASPTAWLDLLQQQVTAFDSSSLSVTLAAHTAYWSEFWGRSHITIQALSPTSTFAPGRAKDVPTPTTLWLQADRLPQAVGSAIAQWPDASLAKVNVRQATASLQPRLTATATGHKAVQFDGVGSFLEGTTTTGDTVTIVAAFRDQGSNSDCCSGIYFAKPSYTGLSTRNATSIDDDDDNPWSEMQIYPNIDWPGSEETNTYNIFNRTVVVTLIYNTSNAVMYVDGCLADVQPPQSAATTSFQVGTRNNELQRFFKGQLHELMVYNHSLADADRVSIEGYLQEKWIDSTKPARCHALPNPGTRISQQYAITRFVQAIQSRTMWPIKFNGMAFVANQPPHADFRDWGSCNWWQNTRLPYGAMLPAGDVDTFETILKYYANILPFAQARTQAYFNHSGIFYLETKTIFGAYGQVDYGCTRPAGFPVWLENNDYLHVDFGGDGGTPEVALAVLDAYMYTNNLTLLKKYLPLVTETADFFLQHYPNRTDDGQYVFWPTQVLETYWCPGWDVVNNRPPVDCVVGDLPTIAGLQTLLEKLLTLPAGVLTAAQVSAYQTFYKQLPPLPTAVLDGRTVLMPAQHYNPVRKNSETPELYSVHPYRRFTVGKEVSQGVNLSMAIDKFNSGKSDTDI
jgi:hypothetical protein